MAICPLKIQESAVGLEGAGASECTKERCAWWTTLSGRPPREGCAIVKIAMDLGAIRQT